MAPISKAQAKWIKSLQLKKYRDEEDVFVAEGSKCVGDLQAHFKLRLLVDEQDPLRASVSSLKTPQGPLAVFEKPHYPIPEPKELSLVLDGVQDPGNVGTIIRTCDWFGIHHIYCSPACADCFAPKVVQATMGALSRVQVHYIDLEPFLRSQLLKLPIYGTLLEGEPIYYLPQLRPSFRSEAGLIIMGSEGNGISEALRPLITYPLLIPSYPADCETSESLNVAIATAIVLSFFRQV